MAGVGPLLRLEANEMMSRIIGAIRGGLFGLAIAANAERSRWPLWLPVALGSGVGFYFFVPFEPALGLAIAAAGVVLAAASISYQSTHSSLRVGCALVCAFLVGFTAAKIREELVAAPVLAAPIGPTTVEGRVDYAQIHGKGVRVVLSHLKALPPGVVNPSRIRISFRSGADILKPGDTIRATAVLMPPSGPAAPGAYDFARTAFFARIGAVGYAYGRPEVISRAPASPLVASLEEAISRLRFRMTARIHEVLPGSTGAIASALITGDRGGISGLDESSLRDAGLAHVLAIAGLHMALVGLGIFWIVRAALAAWPGVALRFPIKKWSACAALAGAAFYLLISGAGAPSIRAFTMLAMMLVAVLFDRPAFSMRAVALAATILLLLEPESLVEPGFQMSFAAVVGLIAVAEWEQGRTALRGVSVKPRFGAFSRYARGIATTSLVGSIATMPYAIFHFDRATHYAVLGNLLAMPIMGFVAMPAAALSVALMPFGLDTWPLRIMGLGITAMLFVGHSVSILPGAVSVVAAWPLSALVLISLGGLWCAIWKGRWRWIGLGPMLVGTYLAFTAQPPDLLIARDARTVAMRDTNGVLNLIGRARDGYSANEWLKRAGDERTADEAIATSAQGVRCDALGCRALGGRGISIAKAIRADALDEDCASSEILVSAVAIDRPCVGPKLVLDLRRVTDSGGFAVWFSPLTVRSVQDERGDRPWSAELPLPDADE